MRACIHRRSTRFFNILQNSGCSSSVPALNLLATIVGCHSGGSRLASSMAAHATPRRERHTRIGREEESLLLPNPIDLSYFVWLDKR